jgi:hypothetical protein
MALGSRSRRGRIGPIGAGTPPPPVGPGEFNEFDNAPKPARRRRAEYEERPSTVEFSARLDVTELDERKRPGPIWPARAVEIGRSRVVIRSRRMCYRGRLLVMALHMIDDKPTPLFGIVHECVYDCDGMHRIDVDLQRIPGDIPAIKAWIDEL